MNLFLIRISFKKTEFSKLQLKRKAFLLLHSIIFPEVGKMNCHYKCVDMFLHVNVCVCVWTSMCFYICWETEIHIYSAEKVCQIRACNPFLWERICLDFLTSFCILYHSFQDIKSTWYRIKLFFSFQNIWKKRKSCFSHDLEKKKKHSNVKTFFSCLLN